ncbi:MAG: diguanylate cyclase [Thiobacillus sp.]|nr:diguanylate cyclase [Thiobacillus sp.]
MAEPGVNINLDNPTEVARETLRRLAMRRIAPTPDNYQMLFEEIVGKPGPSGNTASAATALAGLVMDLNLQYPELADSLEPLDQSIRKNDWVKCRRQLGQITRQLKTLTAGEGRPQSEDLLLLRDLLSKTLEFGVVSQLAHNPKLAEKAQQIAVAVRDARNAATLKQAASSLKSLWVTIELQATDSLDHQETLKRILLLLVENIGELLDDDTWLRGQLNMVQDVIAGPVKIRALQEAEQRLKEVIFKQSLVKHGLREATATLKATMTTFVSRMSDVVAANDEYQEKIASHVERISNTEDVLELNKILEGLLEETRTAQSDTRRAHDQLVYQRDAAQQAENRIKQLETQLAEMSNLIREDPLTHSLNRRGMDDEFAREAARADRYNSPFCIAVIDLDNFKALNDQRGHKTGDEALIHLVKIAQEELRITDQIARMGGEEFLIMLPNTPLDGAAAIITRLQRSLTKKYFLDNNEKVLITFSAGVAERSQGEAQEACIARADAAMYEAKHTGKNRVCKAPRTLREPEK